MKAIAIVLALAASPVAAANMERCSYKTEHDGKITETIESPGLADGRNAKRFADIARREEAGEEGWKGYRIFDVNCVALDSEKPVFHLYVQTENGQVSLQHALTEDACYFVLDRLRGQHDCGQATCSWMMQGNDFKTGECFR